MFVVRLILFSAWLYNTEALPDEYDAYGYSKVPVPDKDTTNKWPEPFAPGAVNELPIETTVENPTMIGPDTKEPPRVNERGYLTTTQEYNRTAEANNYSETTTTDRPYIENLGWIDEPLITTSKTIPPTAKYERPYHTITTTPTKVNDCYEYNKDKTTDTTDQANCRMPIGRCKSCNPVNEGGKINTNDRENYGILIDVLKGIARNILPSNNSVEINPKVTNLAATSGPGNIFIFVNN